MYSDAPAPKTNWHKIAKKGLLISKTVILLSILCFAITLTGKNIPWPYMVYLDIIWFALFIIAGVINIRMNTFRPTIPYDTSHLLTRNEQLYLLLTNVTSDIGRFEEGSSYFFNAVRMYKYSTMILSAFSTILLGLNFTSFPFPSENKYPELAKNVAFVIGAFIAVYSGLMTYWNVEKYWLQNKSVANKLRGLRDEIENDDRAKKLSDPKSIQEKFEKYQTIKGEFYKYWEGALSGRNVQSTNT